MSVETAPSALTAAIVHPPGQTSALVVGPADRATLTQVSGSMGGLWAARVRHLDVHVCGQLV